MIANPRIRTIYGVEGDGLASIIPLGAGLCSIIPLAAGLGLCSIMPLAAGLGLSSIIPLGAGVAVGEVVAPAGVVQAANPIAAVIASGASQRRAGMVGRLIWFLWYGSGHGPPWPALMTTG